MNTRKVLFSALFAAGFCTPALAQQAWHLQPCRAVHTFFLSEPIDVVFCDADGAIVRIVAMLHPWRCTVDRAAASTWEFPAGAAMHMGLNIGDRITSCG